MVCPHCLVEVFTAVTCSTGIIIWFKRVGSGLLFRFKRNRCGCERHHGENDCL